MTLPFPKETYGQLFSRVNQDDDHNHTTNVMPNPLTYMSQGDIPKQLLSYDTSVQMPVPFRAEMPSFPEPNNFTGQSSNNLPPYTFTEPSTSLNYRPNTMPYHSTFPEMLAENPNQFISPITRFPEPDFSSSFPPTGVFASMPTPTVYLPNTSTPSLYTMNDPPNSSSVENISTFNSQKEKPSENPRISNFSNIENHSQGIVPVTDNLYPPLFSGYPPAKSSQISALASLTGSNISNRFEWVYSTKGYIPPEAVGCGRESDGAPLYVSRRLHKQVTHVGMVGPHLKGISFVHNGSVLKQKECYVLCGDIRGLRWVKCMGAFKTSGEKLVEAGVTEAGKAIYIGIVDYRGGMYIGEVGEHTGGMWFAYKGKRVSAPDFYYVLAYNF